MAQSTLANRLETKFLEIVERKGLVKKAAEAILIDLVFKTPVDTSKAISNYQVTTGSPSSTVLPPFFIGKRGSTRGTSSAEVFKRGLLVIQARKKGQDIIIRNNADYVVDLDRDGFHTPFIKPALLKGRLAVRNG